MLESLIAVAAVLAIATFATGLLLPLSTRGSREDTRREELLDAELAAGR